MVFVVGEDLLTHPVNRVAVRLGPSIHCHLCEVLRVRGWRFGGRCGIEKIMILLREIMEEEREAVLTGLSKARSRLGAKVLCKSHFWHLKHCE